MNRIFHARIAWYQYFLLVVLTVNVVGALWCKYILPAVLLILMLIVVITAIRKCHSMKFGRFSVTEYVLIEYGKGKFVSVMPVKEREFVELLEKRLTDYIL